MKKTIILGIVFGFVLLMLPTVFADCETDFSTLEKYYEASKNEDYDSYIALIDTNYVYDYLADEQAYADYVKSAWEVYDTEKYELELLKCNELETGSIIFFNVKATLLSDGEKIKLNRDYAAVFENGKIQFVMDMDLFSLHQSQAYLLQYYNVTKPIIDEELDKAEAISNYIENNEIDYEKKNNSSWVFIIIIVIIAIAGLFYFKKEKVLHHFHKVKHNIKKRK